MGRTKERQRMDDMTSVVIGEVDVVRAGVGASISISTYNNSHTNGSHE